MSGWPWNYRQAPSRTASGTAECPCPKHPFGCYRHPFDCGCTERAGVDLPTADFLAAIEVWKARLFSAETENQKLRNAIQDLHRVWFTGTDVDKDAVTKACLTLFRVAAQSKQSSESQP